MTEAARWNLQHGVPEDRRYSHTTYNAENDFDRYILHHANIIKMVEEMELKKRLEKEIEAQIEKEIDKLLKDFK